VPKFRVSAESLWLVLRKFPFLGSASWRLVRSSTAGQRGQWAGARKQRLPRDVRKGLNPKVSFRLRLCGLPSVRLRKVLRLPCVAKGNLLQSQPFYHRPRRANQVHGRSTSAARVLVYLYCRDSGIRRRALTPNILGRGSPPAFASRPPV
jgi:hypothetical protein